MAAAKQEFPRKERKVNLGFSIVLVVCLQDLFNDSHGLTGAKEKSEIGVNLETFFLRFKVKMACVLCS